MVNKITSPITPLGEIDKINEVIDEVDKKLENTATGTNALTVGGYASTANSGTNLGINSKASGTAATALGNTSTASGSYSTAIGRNTTASANSAIQIGFGTNSTANTLNVGFYNNSTTHYAWQLLDGTTGKIPSDRIKYDGTTITVNANGELTSTGGSGSSRNIGEIVTSTIPLTDAGLHLLDGALISGSGSYGAFVTYISGLVSTYPDLFTTESNWQSTVTQYGVCGKFVYDSVANTVRLPKITGFIEGATDVTSLGDLVQAGLPNITGTVTSDYSTYWSGAFYSKDDKRAGGAGTGTDSVAYFDASLSSSIYGNSSTVQPQSIKVLYYIVVATTTKTEIEVDIDEISTDLNGKADVDGSNMVSSVKKFDGQWVNSSLSVLSGVTMKSSAGILDYSLSTYLPNDNYKYEVLLSGFGSGSSSNSGAYLWVYSSVVGEITSISETYYALQLFRGNGTATTGGSAIIPIGTDRNLKIFCSNTSNATITIRAIGYRRIGTNS